MAKLTDEWLDSMRRIGDPVLDPILKDHLGSGSRKAGPLLATLFRASGLPEEDPLVADAIAHLTPVELDDRRRLEHGQRLFTLFGPEILLILGSCSLPLAYAAGNGVQVVFRARRLKDEPVRRLCDTAQMVINVMQPGALELGANGWNSALKVRLIHALVRSHVQLEGPEAWLPSWGAPINQEDQAGTLLTFSSAVLHCLRRMGAPIDAQTGDCYVFAWSAVGRLLGVDESLLPKTEADAAQLAQQIGRRQLRSTPEGIQLSKQLLVAVDSLFPIAGYAASLSDFLLRDTAFGSDVAALLELPTPNWTRWLVSARAAQKRAVLPWLARIPGASGRRSWLARHFAQRMVLLTRPDDSAPFALPAELRASWGLRAGSQ
jgi:hypothetical protein